MSDCVHKDLEDVTIIIRVPADIAATLINIMSHIEMQPDFKDHVMFCNQPHSVDRYDIFRKELQDKFNSKFGDSELSVDRIGT